MRILSVDTASSAPSLAAEDDARAESCDLRENAAESLPRAATELLSRLGLSVADLDRVAVVSGPGSFTGLRAGLAFARGLTRARGIPLVLVPTFEAASEAQPEPADAFFLMDAGRGDVHLARRRRDGAGIGIAAPPSPRTNAESDAQHACVPVLDLGVLRLPLAAAAARIAGRTAEGSPDLVYGRVSAAEEKAAETAR